MNYMAIEGINYTTEARRRQMKHGEKKKRYESKMNSSNQAQWD